MLRGGRCRQGINPFHLAPDCGKPFDDDWQHEVGFSFDEFVPEMMIQGHNGTEQVINVSKFSV
jgi:hypothetical protein